jgi:hypothetical protein
MSAYQMPRRAIHAGDPPDVFELEAKLLAAYRERIEAVVGDILSKFPILTPARPRPRRSSITSAPICRTRRFKLRSKSWRQRNSDFAE